MIVQQTLTRLRDLRLEGMAGAFEEQVALPSSSALSFEDRVALLVEREAAYRDRSRLTRLLAKARLKYAQAALEDLDTRASRGLDGRLIASLAHGEWLERGHAVLIGGPTGVGKTWFACALAQRACRLGKSALYARVPRLLEELRIARGDGTHKRRLLALAKLDVLVLDLCAANRYVEFGDGTSGSEGSSLARTPHNHSSFTVGAASRSRRCARAPRGRLEVRRGRLGTLGRAPDASDRGRRGRSSSSC